MPPQPNQPQTPQEPQTPQPPYQPPVQPQPAVPPVEPVETVPTMQPNTNSMNAFPQLDTMSEMPAQPIVTAKRSKKPWIIAVAVIVVLLGGGTAGALWWTSPQKAFDDLTSSQRVMTGGTIKGAVTVTPSTGPAGSFTYDTKINGKNTNTSFTLSGDAGMMKVNVTGGFATDSKNNMYFKVNDVRKTITSFAGSSASSIEQYYGTLIDKVDGKWVQVTEADLKELSKSSGVDSSCVMDKVTSLATNASYQKSLSDLYAKNKYISIKETLASEKINGSDSNHYVVAFDKDKTKSYMNGIKDTQWFKDYKTCFTDPAVADEMLSDSSSTSSSTVADPKLELWIDKWTHMPTKFVVTQDQSGTKIVIDGVMSFNSNQAVETPKADTQFKDLQTEINKIQTQYESQTESLDTTVLGTSILRY